MEGGELSAELQEKLQNGAIGSKLHSYNTAELEQLENGEYLILMLCCDNEYYKLAAKEMFNNSVFRVSDPLPK